MRTRILMVEDDPGVLTSNKEYLSANGYDIVVAETLNKARFLLDEAMPDLILLDVTLPDGSGFDFCREIRERTRAPIIFLTARSDDESQLQGLLGGGDDFVTKPYNLNVLEAKIRLRLGDALKPFNSILSMPPMVINRINGIVTLNGEEFALTPKELMILWQLASREGCRVSGEALYEMIWGSDGDGSRTVQVHISNLRKKLNFDESGFFEIRSTKNREYIFSQVRFN